MNSKIIFLRHKQTDGETTYDCNMNSKFIVLNDFMLVVK